MNTECLEENYLLGGIKHMIQLNLFGNEKYSAINDSVDEFFWSYHAGMADGDGCIRNRNGVISYTLELIDKNIIQELTDLYNYKLSVRDPANSKRKDKHKVNRQKSYYTSLCGDNVIHFLKNIYPYMIEKRRFVESIFKQKGIEIEKIKPSQNNMLAWLAGYFDAEGSIVFNHKYYDKTKDAYLMSVQLKWSTTDYTVARYVRRLVNRWFNFKNPKSLVSISKSSKNRRKPIYQVTIHRAIKVYIFGQVFKDIIKIQRKKDKFLKLIDYGNFCARHKFRFGGVNFAKNKERRDKWLEGMRNEME